MISLADQLYSRFLEGIALLIRNPVECAAVGLVQTFSLVVVSVICLLAAFQITATIHLSRRSTTWTDPDLLELFRDCSSRFRLGRTPTLMTAPAGAPLVFTAGYLRPKIHLSRQLADTLDRAELGAVLCHELAHVERRDNVHTFALRVGSLLALALMPAAFTLSMFFAVDASHFGSQRAKLLQLGILLLILLMRRIVAWPAAVIREISCDERAIEAQADPFALAAAIARTWKLQRSRPTGFLGAVGAHALLDFDASAERRISRLIQERKIVTSRRMRVLRVVMTVLMASAVLFVASYHVRSSFSDEVPLRWSRISPP